MEPPHADPESDTEDTDPTKLLNQWLGELNTLKKVNYSSRRHQHRRFIQKASLRLACFMFWPIFAYQIFHFCFFFPVFEPFLTGFGFDLNIEVFIRQKRL